MKKIVTILCICLSAWSYGQRKDGIKRSENGRHIEFYEAWFMPGGGYNFFFPAASDSLGQFSGFSPEFIIYNSINQNDNRGPSHVKLAASISILQSDKEGIQNMLKYGLALNLSIERNPRRNFLIPYFGLEFGGLTHNNFNTLQFTPVGGVFLFYNHHVVVSALGGYVYPLNGFETLSGAFANATINFTLW
ncbi:MAG TPA: hypothetical protein DCS93_14455 [Microscillaceae bacterium]|nr:hypothetical protein [Microscillaceae bacterium]